MSELLTINEVAQLLRVSRETVRRMLVRRKLFGIRVGAQWRVPRYAVDKLLLGQRHGDKCDADV